MSRYILIRRLRGPAILLLIGTLGFLHQVGVIPYFWRLFWPLLLITWGLLLLAERAALASEGYPIFPWGLGHDTGQAANPGANSGTPFAGAGQGGPSPSAGQGEAPTGALVVSSPWQELEKNKEGGQS
ncbi:MAG: hypothetical protein ABSD59_17985 [Terracidiphilus sp.]|jgi:hypothetical protein